MSIEFHHIQEALSANFDKMVELFGIAFETNVDKDEMWNTYLNSFPEIINPIFRVRREHDCSCCRHFIKEIGGVVFIDQNNNRHTIWDFSVGDSNWNQVIDAMRTYVLNHEITGIYISKNRTVGTKENVEYDPQHSIRWSHFFVNLPREMVYNGYSTIDTQRADFRATAQVFKRSLDEISMDAIDTVLDLINSNTLYRGAEWKNAIVSFKVYKGAYDALDEDKKKAFVWRQSSSAGNVIGRIRNHSIGVLLTDITNGVDLDRAVSSYESIVAPSNYKRPKAIFTKKMLDDAKKKIEEMGYMDSLGRRFARLDDITVNNVLFSNRDAAKRMKDANIFDEMASDVKKTPKKFGRVEEVSVEKFISDILPSAKEIDAYVEGKHAQNFVSLIAPSNPDAKSMFKWDNAFCWAYTGNIADSSIKKNVKAAGGKVDGVLRFSIQWNDGEQYDANDLDAHCITPFGEIYFGHKLNEVTKGELDVDIINPRPNKPAVENITFPTVDKLIVRKGGSSLYRFFVHCYSNRGGRSGFRAEIAFGGKIYSYNYTAALREKETINVADVIVNTDGNFSIKHYLDTSESSRKIWNIDTDQFVPVSAIMYSPNYWDGQESNGNKHYLFMLKGCVNDETPNGFYNEYLKNELLEHKRVFEALGTKLAVVPSEDQLSGLGFSSTLRNDLIVKVKTNSTERIMKVKF